MSEEEETSTVRQIAMASLNESVMVSSTDPKEDLEKLASLAVSLFHEVQRKNGKK